MTPLASADFMIQKVAALTGVNSELGYSQGTNIFQQLDVKLGYNNNYLYEGMWYNLI